MYSRANQSPQSISLTTKTSVYPNLVVPPRSGEKSRICETAVFLSFFLGFRRPNLIAGLRGWRTPDYPLRTQEPVPDRGPEHYLVYCRPNHIPNLLGKTSGNSFREIAGLFGMTPRGHVQTLTPRTWQRRQTSCRCVRRGKCRSMKMRVLETERTSSPNVNITVYIQPRGASRSNDTFQRLCGTLWS